MEDKIQMLRTLGYSEQLIEQIRDAEENSLQPVIQDVGNIEPVSFNAIDPENLVINSIVKPFNPVISTSR